MADREVELLNDLLQEGRRAAQYHLVLACSVGCLALFFFMSILHLRALDKDFSKSAGLLVSVIGLLPVRFYFAMRGQMAYLRFLKGQWEDARAQNNLSTIEKLRNQFEELGKGLLATGWLMK